MNAGLLMDFIAQSVICSGGSHLPKAHTGMAGSRQSRRETVSRNCLRRLLGTGNCFGLTGGDTSPVNWAVF